MNNANNNIFDFIAEDLDIGKRIDLFLCEQLSNYTRSAIQKFIESENVTVNSKVITKNYKLRNKDQIKLSIPELKELSTEPQNIELNIVYEDEHLLVVNKPKGMVVHPANGNPDNTLVNALLYHCKGSLSGINGVIRPGIVHRIDKNTSGLLIVAKTDTAHVSLAKQIKDHSFTREYEAVVYGNFKELSGTIDAPIGRHKVDRKKMAVVEKNSKNAVTHFEVVENYQGFAHVRLTLQTGRTHQIRVHMAYIGHPVAGDDVYGPKKVIEQLAGQCLHAKKIGFIHPISQEYLEFDSALPEYFTSFLSKLDPL